MAALVVAFGARPMAAGHWDVGPLCVVGSGAVWTLLTQAPGEVPYAEEVALTLDGGRSWLDRTPPELATGTARRTVSEVAAISSEDAWVSYGALADGSPQYLAATTDGGQRWENLGSLPSPYCSLQFVSASVGWCTVSPEAMDVDPVVIYRSADGGRRWELESRSKTLQAPGTTSSLPAPCDKLVSFSTPTEGWAASVCAAGVPPLYESTDAGRAWVRREVGPLPAGYHLSPGLPADWFSAPVVVGRYGALGVGVEGAKGRSLIYGSSDGGYVWQAVVPPGPPRPWLVDIVTPSTWKLTYERTVLTTADSGRTWRSAQSDLVIPVQEPEYATADDGWYAPLSGTELERTEDGGTSWHHVQLPPSPV